MDNRPNNDNDDKNVRPAHDADDIKKLQRKPKDQDAKLDVELDESFPASDPPSQTNPRRGRKKAR